MNPEPRVGVGSEGGQKLQGSAGSRRWAGRVWGDAEQDGGLRDPGRTGWRGRAGAAFSRPSRRAGPGGLIWRSGSPWELEANRWGPAF